MQIKDYSTKYFSNNFVGRISFAEVSETCTYIWTTKQTIIIHSIIIQTKYLVLDFKQCGQVNVMKLEVPVQW